MLRPRRSEDLEPCVALLREVYEADGYPTVWPPDAARWVAGKNTLAAWVVEEHGAILGHLSLRRIDAARSGPMWREALRVPAERLAVVSRFFVSTRARGRGVGSALLTRAEEHAVQRDLRLVLDVAVENRSSIAFYERRGWRRVGTGELALSGDRGTLQVAVFVLD